MPCVTCVPVRTLATFLVAIVILIPFADCAGNFEGLCSSRCVVANCNSIGIRYGKFCGVGWTGCPGEKPCDDLDACCKVHDECVERKGAIYGLFFFFLQSNLDRFLKNAQGLMLHGVVSTFFVKNFFGGLSAALGQL